MKHTAHASQPHTLLTLYIFSLGVREPQTGCQATRANATTKACQRVCLTQRTINPIANHTAEKNNEGTTRGVISSRLFLTRRE
jgi:hypothetical protein